MEISPVTTERSSFECAVIRVLLLARMSDERWNDDIAYAFSTHRTLLKILGLWPLETKTTSTKVLRSLHTIAQFTILPYVLVELTENNHNAGANIETILYFSTTVIVLVKNASITYNQEKLGVNLDAAIDDWLSIKDDETTRKIMKKYTFKSRMLSFVLLYSAGGCFSLYILAIVAINVKQIFLTDPDTSNNTMDWIPLVPSGSLSNSLTGSQYAIFLIIQIIQVFSMCITGTVVDIFYFNITTHLAGQLEVLKKKFRTFTKKPDTETNYRKRFISLINRHSELMDFYQNLEDTFHFLILFQLVLVTTTLALLGLRLNLCLNENDQVEFTKSALVMNYVLLQSLIYTYGGDFLQMESEGIFYALYATSWFTLPLALMKDLHFAMMRSSIPFRLTGGKFFYVNRETMMYILKTAASYVSVLRIALRD